MNQDFNADRAELVRQLRLEIKDEKVISAMERVPRELFLPPDTQHLAYENMPLPIAEGQTISQPFIVALMTEALDLRGEERVLEVGTGSGYQTAILAELAGWVVSVERRQRLLESASRTLGRLGYTNIELHPAQETLGWPEGAPYDGIIVTAGAPKTPPGLIDQLAEGGKLVIPVGSRYEQKLLRIIKRKDQISTENLGGCRFVPLIAREAWAD
ncbi:MAG: protein-L-isoaspartate(D-aspartate) O-methyltransferase [Dehalococcoidia bacterium]|nr:protein-L-isoaspartate(D-aspartate) O-methyltransferase [Dehalococcoidia bacterium]